MNEIPALPVLLGALVATALAIRLISYRPPPEPKLQECPDCGDQISTRATICPHCGADMEE